MPGPNWVKELPASITVCDKAGVILAMNDRSIETFKDDGGAALIGKSILDCHPGRSKVKLESMLKDPKPNCYTIVKNGKKKLVYQTPWYEEGEFMGYVEIILELPGEPPHYIR